MDPLVSMLNLYEKDFVKFKDVMQINKPELLEFARNYEIIIRTFLFIVPDLNNYDTFDLWSICNACHIAIGIKLTMMK